MELRTPERVSILSRVIRAPMTLALIADHYRWAGVAEENAANPAHDRLPARLSRRRFVERGTCNQTK